MFGSNMHKRSAAVRQLLIKLEIDGYVTRLDNAQPDEWRRTPLGTKKLAEIGK